MSRVQRLGVIATGQGPRPEYITFHRELLKTLGVEVEVVGRHILDGRTPAEIAALAPRPEEDAIHCYVRSPEGINKRFGPGWTEAWIEHGRSIPLIQASIDALEREEEVDAIIWCCAEAYPERAFRSTKLLVLPYRVVLGYAEAIAQSRGGVATIGLFVSGTRQQSQRVAVWRRYPWAASLQVHYELLDDDPLASARRLAAVKPDLVFHWGYGTGLAPGDAPRRLRDMEAILGQPILTPQVISTLFVRSFLQPSVDGRSYVYGKQQSA